MDIQQAANRHFIEDENGLVAEMEFSIAGDSGMIISSTFVNPAYRGQGLGLVLLEDVVARARREGRKVVPLCPYAQAQMDKNPQAYADVRR